MSEPTLDELIEKLGADLEKLREAFLEMSKVLADMGFEVGDDNE